MRVIYHNWSAIVWVSPQGLPSLNKCNEEKRTKKFFQKIQFAAANVGYKKESFHLNSNNTHTVLVH